MEYATLRLQLQGRAFYRSLFARPHMGKGDDTELVPGQTLFVLNLPETATASAVKHAFNQVGEVTSVKLSDVPATTGSSTARGAHIVFSAASALKKALKLSEPLRLVLPKPKSTGLATESREQMQKSVDKFMRKFDAAEKRRKAEEEARHNQMDADGCA